MNRSVILLVICVLCLPSEGYGCHHGHPCKGKTGKPGKNWNVKLANVFSQIRDMKNAVQEGLGSGKLHGNSKTDNPHELSKKKKLITNLKIKLLHTYGKLKSVHEHHMGDLM